MLDRREDPVVVEQKAQAEKAVSSNLDHPGSPISDGSAVSPMSRLPNSAAVATRTTTQRTGRWTPDEKILFLYGLKRFGKGRWKKMSIYLPHRSLVQIKSHAQKVLKRLEAGENVFRRLEENYSVIDSLIVQAAKERDALAAASGSKSASAVAKRKRAVKRTTTPVHEHTTQMVSPAPIQQRSLLGSYGTDMAKVEPDGGRGAVIAAAALCQLSSLGWDKKQQSLKSF